MAAAFYISNSSVWEFQFLHVCLYLFFSALPSSLFLKKLVFDMAILKGVEWCLSVLTCISLVIDDAEQLFMCLFAVCISYLEKCLFQSFAHLKIGLSFCCWVVRILYIFWIIDSYQLHDLQIFSPLLWIVFSLSLFFKFLLKSHRVRHDWSNLGAAA